MSRLVLIAALALLAAPAAGQAANQPIITKDVDNLTASRKIGSPVGGILPGYPITGINISLPNGPDRTAAGCTKQGGKVVQRQGQPFCALPAAARTAPVGFAPLRPAEF
ncbi:MAG: hypothetical protein V4597_21525 [Pseudomonadota bacterium]